MIPEPPPARSDELRGDVGDGSTINTTTQPSLHGDHGQLDEQLVDLEENAQRRYCGEQELRLARLTRTASCAGPRTFIGGDRAL